MHVTRTTKPWRALLGIFIEGVDQPAPRFALAVVDLAQIQNWPLSHLTARAALALPTMLQ